MARKKISLGWKKKKKHASSRLHSFRKTVSLILTWPQQQLRPQKPPMFSPRALYSCHRINACDINDRIHTPNGSFVLRGQKENQGEKNTTLHDQSATEDARSAATKQAKGTVALWLNNLFRDPGHAVWRGSSYTEETMKQQCCSRVWMDLGLHR